MSSSSKESSGMQKLLYENSEWHAHAYVQVYQIPYSMLVYIYFANPSLTYLGVAPAWIFCETGLIIIYINILYNNIINLAGDYINH